MENNEQKPNKVFTFELNKPTRCGHVYTRELFENYHKERMAVCVSSMEFFPSRLSSKQLMNPWSCGYGIITELTDDHLKLEFHETAATSFDVDVMVDYTIAPRALKKLDKDENGNDVERMIHLISFDLIPPITTITMESFEKDNPPGDIENV